jgi:hypothetical protein
MATNFVGGVERVRIAPAVFTEAAVTTGLASAVVLDYIAENTVAYTKNSDTQTDQFAEDKDAPVLTYSAPGPADEIVIGVLQQSPAIMAMLENIVYTPATTKIVTLAKRKVANLMVEITTRSLKDNRKQVIVLPNVSFVTTTTGNLTRAGLQQLVLTGKVGSFLTTTDSKEALSIKTWVTDTGAAIDSTAG